MEKRILVALWGVAVLCFVLAAWLSAGLVGAAATAGVLSVLSAIVGAVFVGLED